MNHEQVTNRGVSAAAKIGYGILLPLVGFIACQLALIGSTNGTGSWDGIGIVFSSLVSVPGLLVINGWVLPLRWDRRRSVLLAGLVLPAVIGAVEYLWLHGPYKMRGAINAAFVSPFVWVWLFIILLCAPLAVSLTYAVVRGRTNARA